MEQYKAPSILYHYTSHHGLIGIVSSKSLWLTNAAYLNDSSESDYGLGVVRQVLEEHECSATEHTRQFFNELGSQRSIVDQYSVYVASFSEGGDMLSQWTDYTPKGNGYSIGFHYQALADLTNGWPLSPNLFPCSYAPKEQRAKTELELSKSIREWSGTQRQSGKPTSLHGGVEENSLDVNLPAQFHSISQCLATTFKHPSFAHEHEWRLCSTISTPSSVPIGRKFRSGISTILPYVELSFDRELEDPDASYQPIAKVIVGPCPDPIRATRAVRMLLQSNGLRAEVYASEIPYRSW